MQRTCCFSPNRSRRLNPPREFGDPEGFVVHIDTCKGYGYFPPETAGDLAAAVANEDTSVPKRMLARFVLRIRGETVGRAHRRSAR